MEDKHRAILDAFRIPLRKDLEPKKLLPHLVSKGILDVTDEQEIKGEGTREDSCDALLEMLPRRGPTVFHEFVETLRNVQPHLADLLEKNDEPCSRCEGFRNERDSARRENQTLNRKIKELNNMITKKSEYHQEENQVLQNSLERVKSEQENSQKLYENLEAEKKDQEQKIRQLTSENKELKQEVTKKTSEIGKILAREQKKNKKLKDSRDKFQAEIEAKDVELQKMREENKRLHEESNAEKPKCDDDLREEVGRLFQMPWPGRVHNYEKDFDTNGIVYALVRNSGRPDSTQISITATRSSDGEGKAIDVLEHRVDREIVSGTMAEKESWWCVDLTENYALYLTHYTLRHGLKTSFSHLLNWQLQGSHDGQSWETLRTHDNDRGLKGKDPYCTCTWAIGGKKPGEIIGDRWKKAFRYFRIFQTGKHSSGRFGIFLSGIELYGVLVKIGR
ncbi:E3 ubiquitin-protein ligase hecd-1-like [Acropora millepora]|uniref:E3 ubiquitin-protein ligase hecd-1-like n=1 Tax=Acropora millepora TaxID=45264 RepID=UPI001CF53085|nr:E3 ubiquitin-protein ligase hecd-1-like [Acropora millepora]